MTGTRKTTGQIQADLRRRTHDGGVTGTVPPDRGPATSENAAENLRQLRGKVQFSVRLDILRSDRA
jgi:hypothetical protein